MHSDLKVTGIRFVQKYRKLSSDIVDTLYDSIWGKLVEVLKYFAFLKAIPFKMYIFQEKIKFFEI